MIPILLSIFAATATAVMPEHDYDAIESTAWTFICTQQDTYSCAGIDPPPVTYVKFSREDYLGFYNGTQLLMSYDLVPIQMTGMQIHEGLHYLQHMAGGATYPAPRARMLCPFEDEAWYLASKYYLSVGADHLYNEEWYVKYPECQVFHLTQKQPWDIRPERHDHESFEVSP